ncbi:hypothetical protein [Anoxynatronum buryatiense]|uniref:Uncharacterized protein n=1 Tax=Anoxynatronum buryatiense TaxID=489973 RepID=A0AA46AHB1_9CLOT|nr:hypothetical protein [Anoxynatronum buryatiense]SMP38281.1 hypothetical protein SAMN06296020_10178 [Anoxynatronum buryatiense]
MSSELMLYYMLAENVEKNLDFIDSLLPFVEYCLFDKVPDKITTEVLKSCVTSKYDMSLTAANYEDILNRLEAKGLVYKAEAEGIVYYEPVKGYKDQEVLKRGEEFTNALDKICKDVIIFAKESMGEEISPMGVNDKMLKYLEKNIDVLISEDLAALNGVKDNSKEDVLFSLYFVEQYEKQEPFNEAIEQLKTLLKGVVAYKYIHYTNNKDKKLEGLKVVLDSPLLIYALGYAGDLRRDLVRELCDTLKSLDAKVYCYEHSVSEARNNLIACENIMQYKDPSYGDMRLTVDHFLSKKNSKTEIFEAIKNIKASIKEIGIEIYPEEFYERADHARFIDEKRLADQINEGFNNTDLNVERGEHDAKAINMTQLLRNNKQPSNLFESEAVFVTKNRKLVYISTSFLNEDDYTIPTTIHYTTLATKLLLMNGIKEPKLPLSIIMERCYSAVAPKNETWDAYIKQLNEAHKAGEIKEIDYMMYRSEMRSRRYLLKKELDDSVSSISIEEVMRYEEAKIAKEKEAVRQEEEKKYNEKLDQERQSKNEVEKHYSKVLNNIEKFKDDERTRIEKKYKKRKWGAVVVIALFTIFQNIFDNTVAKVIFALIAAIGSMFIQEILKKKELDDIDKRIDQVDATIQSEN